AAPSVSRSPACRPTGRFSSTAPSGRPATCGDDHACVETRHGFAGARPSGGGLGAVSGPPARTMTTLTAAIATRPLAKRYGGVEAVRGIDLEVRPGEIFGLIGPDGAGKTSTFQILGGVMEATSGAAEVLGQPPREAREHVGYLTQAFSLYPDLSVAENL